MASIRKLVQTLCKQTVLSGEQVANDAFFRFTKKDALVSNTRPLVKRYASTAVSSAETTAEVGSINRKLYTPGPLMVSDRVKDAMSADLGVRHSDFAYVVQHVRTSLLQIARVSSTDYTAIPLNGSGAFVNEATLRTVLGKGTKKLIIMNNGRYADRICNICKLSGINFIVIPMNMKTLQDSLRNNKDVSGVFVVHCETSSGYINPVKEIGQVVKKHSPDILYLVDAMTSFGAVPLDMKNIDFMMSNSCKSLQGVPGIAFVIAQKDVFKKHRDQSNGLVLDLGAQYDALEKTGEFLFTPPAHVMLAFKEALMEYVDQGGLEARAKRYKENTEILKLEMKDMGFKQLFKDEENPNGYLLTSFLYPENPLFIFEEFYNRLADAGHLICSERKSVRNCFRIGTMGELSQKDMKDLTHSIRNVCTDMKLSLPLVSPKF